MDHQIDNFRIIAKNTVTHQIPIFKSMCLPEIMSYIRRTCLSNQDSIMQSLPTPKVFSIVLHSYVSLSEQTNIMSAHGFVYHMENLDDETKEFVHFMATKAGKVLRDKM